MSVLFKTLVLTFSLLLMFSAVSCSTGVEAEDLIDSEYDELSEEIDDELGDELSDEFDDISEGDEDFEVEEMKILKKTLMMAI